MAYKTIALTVLLLGLILRVVSLDKLPVFADEAIYVRWAQVMRAESTLRFLPLSDGKQPLYMWILMPVFKVVSDPLLAGRLLSAILGCFGIFGVGWLAFLLFKNKRLSLMTMLVYAVIPY